MPSVNQAHKNRSYLLSIAKIASLFLVVWMLTLVILHAVGSRQPEPAMSVIGNDLGVIPEAATVERELMLQNNTDTEITIVGAEACCASSVDLSFPVLLAGGDQLCTAFSGKIAKSPYLSKGEVSSWAVVIYFHRDAGGLELLKFDVKYKVESQESS